MSTQRARPSINRRRSRTASEVLQLAKLRGVFWRPPAAMVSSLVIGNSCAAALHAYYSLLDGSQVGGLSEQQNASRLGTAMALLAQVCLVFSMQKAAVQWLWKELKANVVTFRGIDAAFTSTNDPAAFLSLEMWKKVKVGSTIALLSWLIPVSTLFAPATLNVDAVMVSTLRLMHLPSLSISQAGSFERFAYAVNGSYPSSQKYLSPRTIITRFAVASATTGEIMPLPLPAVNATYQQTFFGPYVHCDDSSKEGREQMDGMIEQMRQGLDPSVDLVSLDYFAQIPALSKPESSSQGVQVSNATDVDFALHNSNQLWIYFPTYKASSDFSEPREGHYLTCRLYNASYTARFTWTNGQQDIELVDRDLLHPVTYPADASTSEDSEDAMAHSSVMWALSSQLTGSMAFYRGLNGTDDATQQTYASRVYSKIDTPMAQTVLLGSNDLNSHFIQNHMLGDDNDTFLFSDQRLQDMAYAGGRSLDVLISELSSNITFSLISDPLLAPRVPTEVTIRSPANIYAYQSQAVIITYSIAGAIAILANVFGLYAFYVSGVGHDLSFSAIACSTHGIHYSDGLEAHEQLGALPLEKRIADTRLRFYSRGDLRRWGFGAADDAV